MVVGSTNSFAEVEERDWDMVKNKNTHSEGFIWEQFVYFPSLRVYPPCSDMNKLSEMVQGWFKEEYSR
jgi:hypothetical protein